eukprot:546544_1
MAAVQLVDTKRNSDYSTSSVSDVLSNDNPGQKPKINKLIGIVTILTIAVIVMIVVIIVMIVNNSTNTSNVTSCDEYLGKKFQRIDQNQTWQLLIDANKTFKLHWNGKVSAQDGTYMLTTSTDKTYCYLSVPEFTFIFPDPFYDIKEVSFEGCFTFAATLDTQSMIGCYSDKTCLSKCNASTAHWPSQLFATLSLNN